MQYCDMAVPSFTFHVQHVLVDVALACMQQTRQHLCLPSVTAAFAD
jgi:hypothetical protein